MNPRQRRGVLLMVLSGIAAVLVFIGVSSYVASVNSRVGPMVTVYRVTTDLPAFTTLSSENTEPAEVPERWAADNTVLRSADIDGRVIATPMTAGSPVSLDILVPPSDLDPTEREIAVNVDAVTGLAGRVRPGDRVDVYAVFSEVPGLAKQSRILVQNVRVVSVQGQLAGHLPRREVDPERDPGDLGPAAGGRPRGHLRQLVRRGGPARRAAARCGAGPQQGEAHLRRPPARRQSDSGEGPMNRAVIAIADQVIVQELRSRLDQSEAQVEVGFVAESTQELISSVLAHRPSIAFVHDQLGPGPVLQIVRDLTLRSPALAVLIVTNSSTAEAFAGALNAGARGVLTYPFGLEDLDERLSSMLEWNQTVRNVLADNQSGSSGSGRGGRVIAAAGAKGGVGTTVVASHLAWDAARSDPNMRVCLVDLDVENGDVPSYLDVSHRVSIADLAKISEDLTARAVADTVVAHSSGLHLLLTPREIRDTEFVTPEAVRRIIAQLRTLYHLVVVDVGSAITTTQAAAVESADMTLQLVTADVPALRAARRQVVAWESLGVAGADKVHVVVNRFVRRSEIQQDTIDMLTLGQRSQILIPDLERGLERAGNSRTPAEVRNQVWWRSLRAIGAELDVMGGYREALAAAATTEAQDAEAPAPTSRRRGRKANGSSARRRDRPPRAARPDRGGWSSSPARPRWRRWRCSRSRCWSWSSRLQAILLGVTYAYSGVASTAAARAVSLGNSPQAAVADALPGRDVLQSPAPRRVVRCGSPSRPRC